jgi:hypothetical protein
MLNKFISLALLTLSLGSLVSCGSKVEDRPVATRTPATTGAVTTTNNNKLATAGNGTIVAPAGITLETDLQQELSTAKNRNDEKFTAKIKNGSVSKYPALKDGVVEGHLENVTKASKGKKATFNLFFDGIKLKNGQTIPVDAALVNTQVESKTKGQFLKNTGIIIGGAVAGHFAGKQADFKNGGLAGAAAATAFVLSSPGGEVVLKKGTDLQLKLKSNLTN